MKTENYIKKVKGLYTFKSPYHKNKRLPFFITGNTYFNDEFPVEVHTIEYRGRQKTDVVTGYSVAAIKHMIENGIILLTK